MKKLISVLLAVLLVTALPISVFAQGTPSDTTTGEAIHFNSDGKLRILHLTDLHMDENKGYSQILTFRLFEKMIAQNNPDIVIITGDIAMDGTKEQVLSNIDDLMNFFIRHNLPVAVTFGNHDTENGYFTRSELMQIYMNYDCCISVDTSDIMGGYGSYNIPVLASDSDEVKFNLWCIDSGDYDSEGHYGYTCDEVISWYKEKSDTLKAANGGEPVHSLMFQHIIVPEIYDVLKKASKSNPYAVSRIYSESDDEYFLLDPETTNSGRLNEYPCPPYYNNGQFDAILEQGDVLAMFFGHDHTNTFNIDCKGVDLVNTPRAKFSGPTDALKGARLITVDENDTSVYSTEVITFGSVYGLGKLDIGSLSEMETTTDKLYAVLTALVVRIFTVFYVTVDAIGTGTVELFTGEKLKY